MKTLSLACTLLTASLFSATSFAFPTACQSLTPAGIQSPVTVMKSSLAKANQDISAMTASSPNPGFATLNRDELTHAIGIMTNLQTWLKNNALDLPYVTNASAAYNTYLYVSDTIRSLHTARHWASVSFVWNRNQAARDSIRITTNAINTLEKLGEQATICYVDRVAPRTP